MENESNQIEVKIIPMKSCSKNNIQKIIKKILLSVDENFYGIHYEIRGPLKQV
jgi:hypothetical protein